MSDIGLMDYKARFYDPTIGRFIQPDTIIPSYANPQSLNRFSYVLNSPIVLNDPTGHWACEDAYSCEHSDTIESQELAEKHKYNDHPTEPVVTAPQSGEEEGAGPGSFLPWNPLPPTTAMPIQQRLIVGLIVAPIALVIDLILVELTEANTLALGAAPPPAKLVFAISEILVAGIDVLVGYAEVSILHWVVTGDQLHPSKDNWLGDNWNDWRFRP